MERAIKAEGQVLLGWRDVPVNADMPMSPTVREKEPIQRQVFIGRGPDVIVQDALERKLYVIRKTASAKHPGLEAQTQQGILRAQHVQPHRGLQGPVAGRPSGRVLQDLEDERCASALGLVHQRFHQHLPEWPLAHPTAMCRTTVKSIRQGQLHNWMKTPRRCDVTLRCWAGSAEASPHQLCGSVGTPPPSTTVWELLTMAGYPISQA